MTAGSYVTGNSVEGKDRFMDEFGTQIIWLLGIPFFKKVIDKTVYKLAKLNPDIDVRLLDNKDIFKKAKEYASIDPNKLMSAESEEKALEKVKNSFDKVLGKEKLFKGLSLAKFAVATALTLISYSALTVFRHKQTEKEIKKEFEKEHAQKLKKANEQKKESTQNPSFGMNLAPLKQFMFDPVKNTMIIDGGITTERLAESRNPQDVMGYAIKEGGFWAFMYFLGPAVQKKLEKIAAKKNRPIDLDIRILQDENFKKMIKTGDILKEMKEFNTAGTDAEIYDSLFKQSDNFIVKMAKKSGIISTFKKSDKIDSKKYIEINDIKDLKTKIQKLYDKYSESGSNEKKFFDDILKFKKASIVKNIAYSIGALGLIVPGIMVAMRFMDKDNKEFQVKKEIHEKLKREHNLS